MSLVRVQPGWTMPGVPDLDTMEAAARNPSHVGVSGLPAPGMSGLGGWGDWIQETADTVIGKINIPGFGTPALEPGTNIQEKEGIYQRQSPGYPVNPAQLPYTASDVRLKTETDSGTGALVLAGIGGLVLLMVLKGGGGGGRGKR